MRYTVHPVKTIYGTRWQVYDTKEKRAVSPKCRRPVAVSMRDTMNKKPA